MNDEQFAEDGEREVREMLRGLNKVGAPSNFDVRLRARLRAADAAPRRRFLGAGFAVPVMAAFVLIVGGLFFALRPPATNESLVATAATPREIQPVSVVPSAAADQSGTPAPANIAPVVESTAPQAPAAANRSSTATPSATRTARRDDSRAADIGGGSSDSSVTGERPRLPQGFQENAAPVAGDLPPASYSVRDAFELNGIGAEFTGGQWIVRTVKPGSVAAVSGVRVNDAITAIDEHPATGETITAKTFSGRTLTVLRGGEQLTIRLKLQP